MPLTLRLRARSKSSAALVALCAALLLGAAATPSHGPVTQVLGRIGRGQPYDAWLAMAPNGRAAVLWALSPRDAGTPLELAVAPPGGRFGRPQMIGKAPFGPIELALAISDSGAVEVAVAPDTGGLFAIRRSPTGHVYPPQHLVGHRRWIAGLSLAAGAGGAMLLAWDSQPRSAQGSGPDTLHTAWLRRGHSMFDRALTVPTTGQPLFTQALFVGRDTAAVSWRSLTLPSRRSGLWLAFGRAGRPFGHATSLATGSGVLTDRLTPDAAGGAFAAVSDSSLATLQSSLSVTEAHSDGTIAPAQAVASGKLSGFQLTDMARGHALLTWATGGKLRAAMVGAGAVTPVPGSIGRPGDYSLAFDPAGTGIIALAPVLWPKSVALPVWRVGYGVVSTERFSDVATRRVGVSSIAPQVAIDSHGRALVLWVGSAAAGGPVEVLRVRAR